MAGITSLEDLLGQVLPHCPGTADNEAIDALREAVCKFCQRTGILTETITITTVADQAAYALAPTTEQCAIEEVEEVRLPGALYPQPDGSYRFELDTEELVFEAPYVPTLSGDAYLVKVVLAPERWASAWPLWILKKWGLGIAAGAAAELLRQRQNPQMAANVEKAWHEAVGDALAFKERQGTGRPGSLR